MKTLQPIEPSGIVLEYAWNLLQQSTTPTLERRQTLGLPGSTNPNMINPLSSQWQTCQLLEIKFEAPIHQVQIITYIFSL